MTINMNDSHIVSISQIKEFLKLNNDIEFQSVSREEMYQWIENALQKFGYFRLRKRDKHAIKNYVLKMTGLSDAQTTRLIANKKKLGRICLSNTRKHTFEKKYQPEDTALLITTDNLHSRMSGKATQKILKREYEVYGKQEYQNISRISPSHIYNLRETRQYISHSLTVKKTNPVGCKIGERRKPKPDSRPGSLRVDSVHQGDLDKEKGVYHINLVDEVTQFEIVGCVEKISEHYLEPLLEDLLAQFPVVIWNFHSDNGSEYINKIVARLLQKLLIFQTKSRSHHSNDNALAECKNGWVVRKNMGYSHIPQRHAPLMNEFYKDYFNPYLNFHRPCGFATIVEDKKKKGKFKKKYDTYMTPYEKLKLLKDASMYLKAGITFEDLDTIANAKSDNECAALMQRAKQELFKKINEQKLKFPTSYASFISGSYVD